MLTVDFCGSQIELDGSQPFFIGREADLHIDDNPFLHRRFLSLAKSGDLWSLSNVGSQLTATVSDGEGRMEAFLSPGASLPLVFHRTSVRFTAGPTMYEFDIVSREPLYAAPPDMGVLDGETTVGAMTLTVDQKLLVLALAEPALRGDGRANVSIPTLAEASTRLGWTQTKFNRKLDNVCQKLAKIGVRGLHGGPDRLATNRRTRLVEYAVATRMVVKEDLVTFDQLMEKVVCE